MNENNPILSDFNKVFEEHLFTVINESSIDLILNDVYSLLNKWEIQFKYDEINIFTKYNEDHFKYVLHVNFDLELGKRIRNKYPEYYI